MLHPVFAADRAVRAAFLREGYAVNGVRHDGVVRVLDDDVAEDGSVYLVMERLDGETLNEKLERTASPFAVDEALRITDCVLDVLGAAHAQGIQHRDVAPKNVFLRRDGRIQLFDFGSAFVAEREMDNDAPAKASSFGTPAFMSPELARGRFGEVDPRSDVYSCGAVLFALLTGNPPRRGETVNEELCAAMTEPLPSLAATRPDLPGDVVDLVDRAVAFEKTDRWPGAKAMQEALARARASAATSASVMRTTAAIDSVDLRLAATLILPPKPTVPTLHTAGPSPIVLAGAVVLALGSVVGLAILVDAVRTDSAQAVGRAELASAAVPVPPTVNAAPPANAPPTVPIDAAPKPEGASLTDSPPPPPAPTKTNRVLGIGKATPTRPTPPSPRSNPYDRRE